jgi:hypothetical protein
MYYTVILSFDITGITIPIPIHRIPEKEAAGGFQNNRWQLI